MYMFYVYEYTYVYVNVCVCVCMYVYVCMHACMHVCMDYYKLVLCFMTWIYVPTYWVGGNILSRSLIGRIEPSHRPCCRQDGCSWAGSFKLILGDQGSSQAN